MQLQKTVLIPKGTGFVNATIYFNNSVRIVGENTDGINRAQSFVSVDGNISLFALAQGSSSGGTKMIQLFIDGLLYLLQSRRYSNRHNRK